MGRSSPNAIALILSAGLVLSLAPPARAFDVILDPQEVNKLLNEIGKLYDDSKKAPKLNDRLDALYEMGERTLDLADLMSKDQANHGGIDPSLGAVIQRRLKPYAVNIVKDTRGYHYDLAAFHEYLRLAPTGERAADAKYVLIGFDEPGENIAALQKSIAGKDSFIRQYPNYSEMSLLKFMLAQQHVRIARLYKAQNNSALSSQHRQKAENLFRLIVKQFPQSEEAEAAADYLAQTGANK